MSSSSSSSSKPIKKKYIYKKKPQDPYKEKRLYYKRGLCPNRYELLSYLFNKAKKIWVVPLENTKSESDEKDKSKLEYLYVDKDRRLYFLRNHHLIENEEDVSSTIGYFIIPARTDVIDSYLIKEEIKLYFVSKNDIPIYFPMLSEALVTNLTKNHHISINSERLIRAKWDDLIADKEKSNEFSFFYCEGFSRLKTQTTGKIFGKWL